MDFIDSQTRRLFHLQIEMRGKNLKKNLARIRPKIIQYNGDEQKFYYHSLFVIDKEGYYEKTPYYLIKKPPKDICKIYEQMKTSFTDKLNLDIEKQLDEIAEKNNTDPKKELNPDSMQPMIWEVAQLGYVKQGDIEDRMSKRMGRILTSSQFHRNVMSMRKKGFDIRIFKKIEN
ncbi:unnamed protein product [marine sediment metagenome]|uniref:Uncharacterized protein n=1 Tax=marine sediment metagenome TaxID=412755 RepID=X1FAA8_9ZZZZ